MRAAMPDIQSFRSCREFLAAFFADNDRPSMTVRSVARRLKWNHSLISDVVSGRRSLPLAKALQFAKFFRMDELATERLILLVLNESSDVMIRSYATALIERRSNAQYVASGPQNRGELFEADVAAVKTLYSRHGRVLAREEVRRCLKTMELTDRRIDRINDLLLEAKFLEREGGRLVVAPKHGDFFRDVIGPDPLTASESAEIHRSFLKSQQRYLDTMDTPRTLNSACFALPLAKVEMVKERILSWRNWLATFSKDCREDCKDGKWQIFQLEMSLFSISPPQDSND